MSETVGVEANWGVGSIRRVFLADWSRVWSGGRRQALLPCV